MHLISLICIDCLRISVGADSDTKKATGCTCNHSKATTTSQVIQKYLDYSGQTKGRKGREASFRLTPMRRTRCFRPSDQPASLYFMNESSRFGHCRPFAALVAHYWRHDPCTKHDEALHVVLTEGKLQILRPTAFSLRTVPPWVIISLVLHRQTARHREAEGRIRVPRLPARCTNHTKVIHIN
jgi:hypothetical protein